MCASEAICEFKSYLRSGCRLGSRLRREESDPLSPLSPRNSVSLSPGSDDMGDSVTEEEFSVKNQADRALNVRAMTGSSELARQGS